MTEFRGAIDRCRPLGELDLASGVDIGNLWKDVPNWTVQLDDDHVDVHRRLVANAGFAELGRIVDIGSGFGRLSIFLAERNSQVIGVDRNRAGVAMGDRLAHHLDLHESLSFILGDGAHMPLESGSCDGVWFFSALQFMQRGAVLAEARRLLRPGGLLFVGRYNTTWTIVEKYLFGVTTTAGRQSNQCGWARRALTNGVESDAGANWLTPDTVNDVMARHGFAVDSVYGVQATPPWSPAIADDIQALFADPAVLIDRLDSDDGLVSDLTAQQGRLALAIPGDIQFVARVIDRH